MSEEKEFELYTPTADQVIEVEHNEVTTDDTVQDIFNTDSIEDLNDGCEIENIDAEEVEIETEDTTEVEGE